MKKKTESLEQEVTDEIRKILDDMDKFAEEGSMEGLVVLGRIRTGKGKTQTVWKFAGFGPLEVVSQIEFVKLALLLRNINTSGEKVKPPERKH